MGAFAVGCTSDARTLAVFAFRRNKVDICDVEDPFYSYWRKSGSNRCSLGRSTLWKREEVSAMLITDWNAATRALPVLHLKSNYLDRWPNDCTTFSSDAVRIDLTVCSLPSHSNRNMNVHLWFS